MVASQAFPVFARSTGAAISSRFTTVGIWESSHHPFGVRSFFSYFIFVFSIWFVSNGSVGWKESRRLLLRNETKKSHVFVIPFVFYRSSLVILIISDVIFLCVDITGCVSYTWMDGCCWARLDDGGGWLIHVQLWFVGESQKATEKRSFFF